MGLYNYTIYSIFKSNARVLNGRVAFRLGDQTITYGQFLEKVDSLATGILKLGLKKGDRIAVLSRDNLEYVLVYGVAAKVGAVMVPINWRLTPEEIEFILKDSSPVVLFLESAFQDIVRPLVPILKQIKKIYCMDRSEGEFESFYDLEGSDLVHHEVNVNCNDDYLIIYTAGVSGKPRGALLTQQNLILTNLKTIYYWSLTKEDVHLLILPLFHTAGLNLLLSVMVAGGLTIINPKFEVNLILKQIQDNRVTVFAEFHPMLQNLVQKAEQGNYDLSSLRHVYGVLDPPGVINKFEQMSEATFWSVYGQSETSGLVTQAPYSEKPGSVGMPTLMADVEIMDDYGNLLGAGKSGEIVVRGPLVFKGYWNLEEDNRYTFREGWHHTGDTGQFDEEGYLWYVGRTPDKDLIKTGGENVYPAEVEKVILDHPAVESAVVIGVPDADWGEAIKAICVLKEGVLLNESDIIQFVAERVARFKKPKYVVFTLSLPTDSKGLIDRKKVKAEYGAF